MGAYREKSSVSIKTLLPMPFVDDEQIISAPNMATWSFSAYAENECIIAF